MADVKKPPTAPTVTLKHLAAQLAEGHQLSKKQSEAILGDLVSCDHQAFEEGRSHSVCWPGHSSGPQARRAYGT